jgi:hypothetical protein
MNQSEDRHEPSQPQPSIFNAALRIFGAVPRVLSSLLSFVAIAYLIGWFEARAYFRAFDAEWILPQVGNTELLRFSWTPIITLAFFMWLGLTDLAQAEKRSDSKRFAATRFIVHHGWWPLLLLLGVTFVLEAQGYYKLAEAFSIAAMFGYVLFAGAVFETIVLLVRADRFVGDLGDAGLVYGVVIAGFYFVPTINGSIEGRIAANPSRSKLPVIETSDRALELRLLLLNEGTVYAVELGDGTPSTIKIHVIPLEEVRVVKPWLKSKPQAPPTPQEPAAVDPAKQGLTN